MRGCGVVSWPGPAAGSIQIMPCPAVRRCGDILQCGDDSSACSGLYESFAGGSADLCSGTAASGGSVLLRRACKWGANAVELSTPCEFLAGTMYDKTRGSLVKTRCAARAGGRSDSGR